MRRKKLRVYLSGGMEYAKREGEDWRRDMQRWIESELGHTVFNPNEASRSFLARHRVSQRKFRRLKTSDIKRFTNLVSKIVDLDSREVAVKADYIICLWNIGAQKGAGTKGELTLAKYFDKPVYVVTRMNHSSLPGWILGCTTKIFPSFASLTKFLKIEYK